MGQRLEMDMTYTYPTMHHPIEILTQTLVTLTVHLVDLAITAHSLEHSWREHITSNQMRLRLFTNKPKQETKRKRLFLHVSLGFRSFNRKTSTV